MKSHPFLLGLVACSLAGPSLASADLGESKSIAIQGLPRLELLHTKTTDPDGDSVSSTTGGIGLAAHYFVAEHVAVGGGLQLARTWGDGDTRTMVLAQAIGSYELTLRPRLHVWPQALVAVMRQSVDRASHPKVTALAMAAYAPVVYELADHFFVGWGPMFGTTLWSEYEWSGIPEDSSKYTAFGAQAMVGGWF